jgi:hypothetical protein
VVLSRDRFLDGVAVTDLPRRVEVVPTDGAALVAALRGDGGFADRRRRAGACDGANEKR